MSKNEGTFIEPSASGPTQKLVANKDGTTHVLPGKAHEAKEGTVTNPGVRTTADPGNAPVCPVCKRTGTLKMRMNRKIGERIYCSHLECNYDQGKQTVALADTTVLSKNPSRGVQIMTSRSRG